MKRWIGIFCPLIVIFILVSYGFKTTSKVVVPQSLRIAEPTPVLYPEYETQIQSYAFVPPYLGSSFIGFKEALAFRESQGNYFIINTLGYLGKYQFGIGTLQLMGVYNATQFLKDPRLQERVFHTNISRNKWILRRDIERYVGKRIRGLEITESGILAAAHLAGPGNVQKYLRSHGAYDVKDAYGTSLSDYLGKFSGYDISAVQPKRNPRIR